MFAIQLGFGFSAPYVALYLYRDFNIRDPGQLALLTGIVAGSVSLTAAVVGPIWGVVGDRYGRRPMLIRAIAGGGIAIVAGGLAPNVATLLATRVSMGLSSGVTPAGTALVAEGTPPSRLGWALGVTASARAIGQAVGPILGALLASFLPLRVAFVSGGIVVLLAVAPVVLLVKEPPRVGIRGDRGSIQQAIRSAPRGTARAIIMLAVCQGLVFFAVSGMQQLIVLRVLSMHVAFAALATGIIFSAFGIATAIGATQYSRLIPNGGFKAMAVVTGALLGCGIAAAAVAPSVVLLVSIAAYSGLSYGALFPALNSMLGLEAPARMKATVFGFAGSFTALGSGLGPLTGGTVASFLGLRSGLLMLASAPLVVCLLVWAWGREPAMDRLG